MSQLVDQGDLGVSSEHRVEVHLLQAPSPVVNRLARDDLKAVDQLLGERPPVALDEPDDDVSTPLLAAMTLGEHGVGLADAGSRAQVDAEGAYLFDLLGDVRVRRRGVAHAFAGPLGAGAPDLLGDLGGLPLRGSPLVKVGRLDAVSGVPDHQPAAFHSGSAFDDRALGGRVVVRLHELWAIAILVTAPASWACRTRALCSGSGRRFARDRWRVSFPAVSVWIGTVARQACPNRGMTWFSLCGCPVAWGRTLTTFSEWIQR